MKAAQLAGADIWWNGPVFLTLPDNQWPITLQGKSGRGDAMKGIKPESKSKISVTSTNEATEHEYVDEELY